MALIVKSWRGNCQSTEIVDEVISRIEGNDYKPMIREARREFLKVFGEDLGRLVQKRDSRRHFYASSGRFIRNVAFGLDAGHVGDLFPSPGSKGFLYLVLWPPPRVGIAPDGTRPSSNYQLEAGYVGDDSEVDCLEEFIKRVVEAIPKEREVSLAALDTDPRLTRIAKTEGSKFVSGDDVSPEDVTLANILVDSETREIALTLRRAGGMLADDMTKRVAKTEATQSKVEALVKTRLFTREYAVICRQTSNQVNRVKSLDVLERLKEHEVQCSCGKPIGDERVQELFSPSHTLQRLLNQSYWMTAKLVETLKGMGVSGDRIMLNLQDGPEEIDTFADLEGGLLMFELKDSEFSLGHAYPFTGRIGIYRPDYAIIVSTVGVAPEVKAYVGKIRPGARVHYVEGLDQLREVLMHIRHEIYNERAFQTLALLDETASVEVSLPSVLASKLGLTVPQARRGEFVSQ